MKLISTSDIPYLCMYDQVTLLRIFDETGIEARCAKQFESAVAEIREVELA